jgi:SAM-dependent methyltransferase
MADIRTHYEELLGPVYSWMMGGAEERLAANRRMFDGLEILPGRHRGALDLGAGSGFQSIPLAERGFSVTAVDLSPTLLAELRDRAGALPIRTLERDFLPVTNLVAEPQGLVICAGDTLSHLSDHAAVEVLIAGAASALASGGRLLLTWRDLTTLPRDEARFMLLRSSPDRIFACFVEELDAEHARITDIFHERRGEVFLPHVSSYVKLRVAPARVDALLEAHGFAIDVATVERGLVTRVATKRHAAWT